MTAYVWLLCLISASGGLLFGYDNGSIDKPSRDFRSFADRAGHACTIVYAIATTAWLCRWRRFSACFPAKVLPLCVCCLFEKLYNG